MVPVRCEPKTAWQGSWCQRVIAEALLRGATTATVWFGGDNSKDWVERVAVLARADGFRAQPVYTEPPVEYRGQEGSWDLKVDWSAGFPEGPPAWLEPARQAVLEARAKVRRRQESIDQEWSENRARWAREDAERAERRTGWMDAWKY